jgi:serine phosphatase RsbU (regulator of sigma subunit)
MGSEVLHLSEETLNLEPGDRLVLFTDGLVDAGSPDGEQFKRASLANMVLRYANLPLEDMGEEIFVSVTDFQGTADQYDDMTILLVEVGSNPTAG